ncbi:MAG: ANTAR domain-containing protein [Lachnospiraceae bacterium]|nr:ANTAR domain-containing protein [Lachnospiraceae bacterium]
MADIIISFPKLDDAKNLRRLLVKNGHDVALVCDSGAQIVNAVNSLDGGIVICGYRFSDMHYSEIHEYLPKGFQMLLLASPAKLADCDVRDMMALPMPFKVQDLLSTLETMLAQYYRWKKKQKKKPKARSEKDKKIILQAKELLMERNHMNEEEAHHYIQKVSMDSGTNMVETAEMILELNGKEWDL